MFPLFLPGDKVEIQKAEDYFYGDIVAYLEGERLIAHRIIYSRPGGGYFITKGDNNLKADGKVPKDNILGRIVALRRGKNSIKLEHLYYTQSAFYLSELTLINKILKKEKINYIILRGLVPYLYFTRTPPQRLFADCDIYVNAKDFEKAAGALALSGFKRLPATLFGRQFEDPTEITLQKNILPYPVRIDLHRALGIPFTKLTHLNALFPKITLFERDLLKNTIRVRLDSDSFPILNKETLFVYTILHWYRHNYEGAHRMELAGVLKKAGLNWKKVTSISKKYGVEGVIFLGLALAEKYLGWDTLPLKTGFKARLLASFVSPFRAGNRLAQGIKRIVLVILLSPRGLFSKLALLLSPKTLIFVPPAIASLTGPSGPYITRDYAAHGLARGSKTKARSW